MIFADKLIELRKKSGWSQEELAQQLEVSRQSVSKWEGAQSIPDMNKLIKMSEIFNVSLDTLVKDELPLEQIPQVQEEPEEKLRKVSMEDAHAFLKVKLQTAPKVALGVMLCILSPVLLILLSEYSQIPGAVLAENMAEGLGLMALLTLIAVAVALFLLSGGKTSDYRYLDKESIETAYGVSGMVKEEQKKYRDTYQRCNVIGVLLCILSVMPLFMGMLLDIDRNSQADFVWSGLACVMLTMVSVAVYLFVRVGIRWASYEKLLQEGDYTARRKHSSGGTSLFSGIYWGTAVALFVLLTGVAPRYRGYTHIYWSVTAIAFIPVALISRAILERKK